MTSAAHAAEPFPSAMLEEFCAIGRTRLQNQAGYTPGHGCVAGQLDAGHRQSSVLQRYDPAPILGPRAMIARTVGVVVLLALYYFMALSAAAGKSLTFDEMAHLTAGFSYWRLNDYRLNPENGNLPQRLGALPAVLSGASFPRLDQPEWAKSDVYAIGDQFLYGSGQDADQLLQRGRAVMALLGVVLGAVVFVWAHRLISPSGAWVSLVLYAFSPTLLAHGPLVTSDMATALFFTAAIGALWIALHRTTPPTVLAAATLVACAFLSKLSAPILIPVIALMVAARLFASRGAGAVRAAIVLAASSVVTAFAIWAAFGFRYAAFAAATTGGDAFLGHVEPATGVTGRLLGVAQRVHLLPEAYLYAANLTVQFASERAAFLNGEFSTTGWWWYFPYAFLVKTTIPAMLLGLLAIAALVRRWARQQWYAATPLLSLVAVYWLFALTTHLNIGHRHLLPIYPALCVLAGGVAYWGEPAVRRSRAVEAPRGGGRKTRARQPPAAASGRLRTGALLGVGALLVWHVAESLSIRPDYLAYFNQLAGGASHGYEHLADSSLDWGQDLPALKRWLDAQGLQGAAPPVYLSYFGTARPEHYGVRATRLAGFIDRRPPEPPVPLGGGVYCISATVLDVISRLFYTPADESRYQAAFKSLVTFAQASQDERAWSALMQKTGDRYWQDLFTQYDQLRTGRLVAFLRQRQPDAMVGYSILIYRLSDADVDLAINGAAPR